MTTTPISAKSQNLLEETQVLISQAKLPKAIKIFQQLFKLNPANTSIINQLGMLYLHADQVEKGLEIFKVSLKIDSKQVGLYTNIANNGVRLT